MNVLIGYESHGGHTHQVAEGIADAVRRFGVHAIVRPFADIQVSDVEEADALFVGTWVQGLILFGVNPAGARQWVAALPPIAGKPVGVFCTYAFNPRGALDTLCTMLEERGAVVDGVHAFHRDHLNEGVEQFVQSVLKVAAVQVR